MPTPNSEHDPKAMGSAQVQLGAAREALRAGLVRAETGWWKPLTDRDSDEFLSTGETIREND